MIVYPRTSGTLSQSDIKAANDREEKYCRDKFPTLSLSLFRNDPLVGYSFRRKFMGVKKREESSKETCPRDNKNGSDADPRQILQISSH